MIRQASIEIPIRYKQAKATVHKGFFTHALRAAAFANILLVVFVVASLLSKTSAAGMMELFSSMDTMTSIILSILSVLLSSAMVTVIGIPAAFHLARAKGRAIAVLENFIYLPMVFPPAVTGLALLAAFGRGGNIGGWLAAFGVMLPFSFAGVVLVQVFVTLPFFIQVVRNGFASVDIAVEESARVFGAGDRHLLFQIYMPMSRYAIFSGLIVCMLRAAGEFGATIMFAGNLVGSTQTMTTRVYSLFQQDIGQAVCLAAIQLFVFILPLFLLKLRYREGAVN